MEDDPTGASSRRAAIANIQAAHPYLAESCAHTAPGQVS